MSSSARLIALAFVLLGLCLLWYIIASDYSDAVASGTYHLTQGGETSTLVLKSDHTFQQELRRSGHERRAAGTWRRLGEGGLAFSKEFLVVSGQEPAADGTPYGEMHKDFGLFVSITLKQYHVLWYGRVDPSPDSPVSGTYAGDEQGVTASLILKPDHTFEQSVAGLGVTRQAKGSWAVSTDGNIVFSKEFLKASGEPLAEDETASAWDPKGGPLQINIAITSKLGVPTFRKTRIL
ncbi:MAG: hypothetical protein ABSG72_22910 [Candidatus Sulfotelmatobacter sp.]|jgi:hypothetical protein